MKQGLSGKTALVTGAASGIGAACAVSLAAAGAKLILADRADVEQTRERIEAQGTECMSCVCDIADKQSVAQLFSTIDSHANHLDIVVNSAGILIESKLADMSVDDFDRIIAVNLRGTFLIGKHAMPMLQARADSRFIAVVSELAYLGRADFSAYCASKAGVIGLVRSWAREFAPNVLVNSLAPGPVDTPMLDLDSMSPQWRDKESEIPLGRVAQPGEIADVVTFLAGPGASFMTGQTVSPSGGAIML